MQCGGLGLGTLFTQWIPLLQSLGTLLTMLPFCWLSLGSQYFTTIAIGKPFATIGFAFSMIIVNEITTTCHDCHGF